MAQRAHGVTDGSAEAGEGEERAAVRKLRELREALRWRDAREELPTEPMVGEVAVGHLVLLAEITPDHAMVYLPKLRSKGGGYRYTGQADGRRMLWDEVRGWRPLMESVNTLFRGDSETEGGDAK